MYTLKSWWSLKCETLIENHLVGKRSDRILPANILSVKDVITHNMIVSPQSSVKINQISLDESGEHVGICSEDGKVRSYSRKSARTLY